MYKIILTGYRDPDLRFDTERMDRDGNLLEVIDETAPQYDMEELLQEMKESAGRVYPSV